MSDSRGQNGYFLVIAYAPTSQPSVIYLVAASARRVFNYK